MKNAKILTDIELRAHWYRTREKRYTVAPGTYVTPAARDFIREHQIELCCFATPASAATGTMTVTPIPMKNGKAEFADYATGRPIFEKTEDMTHIRGNLLVSKRHPRIAFRGKLDSLMAKVMSVQVIAADTGAVRACEELDELLAYIQAMLGAEVKDEPLAPMKLLGMDSAEIRRCSHRVKEYIGIDHPIPSWRMGRLCVALNELRTQVRETELSAVNAFAEEGQGMRSDIIEGLNRLSSCVYILFCRAAAGQYGNLNGSLNHSER